MEQRRRLLMRRHHLAGDALGPEAVTRSLVALHAKAFSSTMWFPLLPALTTSHRVFMLDALGDLNKSVASSVLSSPDRVVSWLDERRRRLLTLAEGFEHPGDPAQPDNTHRH